MWQDPSKTAAEIRKFSPHDAEAYLEYARFLDALSEIAVPFMRANPLRPQFEDLRPVLHGALKHRRLLGRWGRLHLLRT